jgi:tetrahydromethanopterin S-methyltransferase F subunit
MSSSDLTEKIPMLGIPNVREYNRMVDDLERRGLIIGRDQRTFSGIIGTRVTFIIGFLVSIIMILLGLL